MQGPKRPRRCTLPNLGGHPSCGIRCPLNPPNRRIRTRTYGGVGGAEPRGFPLSRLETFGTSLVISATQSFQCEEPDVGFGCSCDASESKTTRVAHSDH